MSTGIGKVWHRARITLGLSEQALADGLRCEPLQIGLAEVGDLAAIRKLNGPFAEFSGVDLYVLHWCLSELGPDLAPLAAPLAEALADRLRQLGRQLRADPPRPVDWSGLRTRAAMGGKA